EADALLTHAVGKPVMLIDADPSREWKIGAHANKHAPPAGVVDIDIVLNNPSLCELEVPAVCRLIADGNHNACRLARFENDDDRVRFRTFEVGIDEVVTTPFRGIHHRDLCVLRATFQPLLEVIGDAVEYLSRHRIEAPIGVEEAYDPFWLL